MSPSLPSPNSETLGSATPGSANLDVAINHHQSGRLEEAEQLYRRILEVSPRDRDALHLLGVVAHQTGRDSEAIDLIRQSLELDCTEAKFHNSLGAAYQAQGNLAEALACYQRSVMLDMDYPEAHHNLGVVLLDQGRTTEAVTALRRAVWLKADYANAHNSLGTALRALGHLEEAAASIRRALQLREDFGEAHNNLGNTMKDLGRPADAIPCYERAVELLPDANRIRSNLLCALHYRTGITPRELATAHEAFERTFGDPVRAAWKPHDHSSDPNRRLRLGFVSPDLHRHPVGYFLIGLLEHLDREQAESICYSSSTTNDDLAARLRAAATTWRVVHNWSDERLADAIRADGIDILFDLSGHTGKNRLMVFARKPAPIQISWAGYVGTTGLKAIDYLLADEHEVPPAAESHHAERVLRMPDAYVCYEPPAYAPSVSPLPALEKGYVTFGSFNNPTKIGDPVVHAWSRILDRVPRSRLVLKYKGMQDPALAGRLAGLFSGHGIDPERVAFLGRSPHAELLAHYNDIDVALDPFPYNGGLTTLESLWMGVPVITCPGETFAGRHGLTHLSNLGSTATIARDPDEYVCVAAALANDLPELAAMRAGLRDRMASSPLCDGERFAANFLRVIRDAWREWTSQQATCAL